MKVIFIMGATASGKTELALQLASMFNGEIINCDSIQVYQGLDIGSAKPSLTEMSKVPHHLYSHVKKGVRYTAGDYERDSMQMLKKIKAPLAIVVGGSGFYFNALENGMFSGDKTPIEIKQQVETLYAKRGLVFLYDELERLDPDYAKRISQSDTYRICRANEILLQGKKPSDLQNEFTKRDFPYPLLKIALKIERKVLRERITSRTKNMLENGLIEETKNLLAEGHDDWSALDSVGYREARDYLDDFITPDDLEEKIITKTMQLAKKQVTWFKRDKDIKWCERAADAIRICDTFIKEDL